MASPSPPSPPPAAAYAQVVTSEEVVTSVAMSLLGGAFFLGLWAIFRAPLRHIYLKRTQLPDISARPAPLNHAGLVRRCLGYFAPVFLVTDAELMQTAGLDALILTRFLVLGMHIFIPITVLSCAIILPLVMTGTYVYNVDSQAGTSEIMKYTLSNLEPGSDKLWASWALSYVFLAWTGWCLWVHYRSYALLRLVHLRHGVEGLPGDTPRQRLVGFEHRGWPTVRDSLLKLISPSYMLRCDEQYVRQSIEAWAAAEATEEEGRQEASVGSPLLGGKGGGSQEPPALADGEQDYSKAAVLPWWLPPEKVPAEHSAELGSCVPAGKTDPGTRKRALGVSASGRRVWVSAEQYAVLFTMAGPLPSKELWRLLRPPSAPAAVSVEGAAEGAHKGEGPALGAQPLAGTSSQAELELTAGQGAREGEELVASRLEHALRDLFPASFTQLVRVYNHQAVDKLLLQHDAASTQRDRTTNAVAALRLQLKDAEAAGGGDGAGPAKRRGGAGKAAARLARAEAQLAKEQEQVLQLEAEIEEARSKALSEPLGTAFFALFSDQTSAAIVGSVRASLLPAISLNVRPAPGPDDVNYWALWSTFTERLVRGAAVIPFLCLMMLFPVGVLCGALTQLNTAVCSGTAETNKLYWSWYCEQTDFWAKFLKGLLQGILPSVISMLWDTYVLPMAFFFSSQSEKRHLALTDLDRRILVLFFCFNVYNTFLGSVLGGAIFQQMGSLINEPGYWLQILGAALPSASTYFLNYIIIHALSTNWFRFVWPHEGTVLFVIFRWLGFCRPKCERDECMIRTAPSFRGARHFGSFTCIHIMALSYAVIAPLVQPAAAAFFFTAWVTWRYCCIYFYQRSYESGGRVFETLFKLMVWTMALFSVFSALVIASKRAYPAALVMLFTQLPAIFVYRRKVVTSVGSYARHLPLQATRTAPRARIDPQMYVPPPLRPQAVGWYQEWGKLWEKYGVSRYSI